MINTVEMAKAHGVTGMISEDDGHTVVDISRCEAVAILGRTKELLSQEEFETVTDAIRVAAHEFGVGDTWGAVDIIAPALWLAMYRDTYYVAPRRWNDWARDYVDEHMTLLQPIHWDRARELLRRGVGGVDVYNYNYN
jgi:hypothetical protein